MDYLNGTLGWADNQGKPVKTIKQGMEEYLLNKCKVSQDTINKIREIMLEPAN